MTLEEKISSLLMLHVAGTDPQVLRDFAERWQPGGLILMRDNVPSPPDRLATLTEELSADPGLPLLVAIDQEGGTVRRIPTDEFPAAPQLRAAEPAAAEAAFADRAAMLAALGISVNFGVVADVTPDRSSFLRPRVLGDTAEAASPRVAAAVAGERGQVLTTLKHFPGHGAAPGDSHSSIPATGMGIEEWRDEHAPPFAAGIEAGAEFVMTGHLRFDAVDSAPASLSAEWHRILREELDFDGIIVTDDLHMLLASGEEQFSDLEDNALRALQAGATLLLFVGPVEVPAMVDRIAGAVRSGELAESIVDDAALRLLELRRELSGQTGPYVHCGEECLERIR